MTQGIFTCSECDEEFDGNCDRYVIISMECADLVCGPCHQALTEWTEIANAAIRKARGPEEAG